MRPVMFNPDDDGCYHLCFLLLPGYSMASLQAAIAPLHQLNKLLGKAQFSWQLLGLNKQSVFASNGLALTCESYQYTKPQNLLLCAGQQQWLTIPAEVSNWLRQLYRLRAVFCSIGGGCQLLAGAGLLNSGQVSVRGEVSLELRRRFQALSINEQHFTLAGKDTPHSSCTGGFAASSMMLQIIRTLLGEQLSQIVAKTLILPCEQSSTSDHSDARLQRAQLLMQAHLASPLSSKEMADDLQISTRQLERLFKRHLQQTPSHYYLKLRLDRARYSLRYTNQCLISIAANCGFKSLAHFSRNYSQHMGVGPKRERTNWQRNHLLQTD